MQVLNPKNYAFVPSIYTQKIRPAGQGTRKSESLGSLLRTPEAAGSRKMTIENPF